MRCLAIIISALILTGMACEKRDPQTFVKSETRMKSTKDLPPRKVIVGTCIQGFWGKSADLDERLKLLCGRIDQMADTAKAQYGRYMDLAVLPEEAVTFGRKGEPWVRSLPFDGKIKAAFVAKARQYNSYLVVPMDLLEDKEKKIATNSCILLDRKGKVVGIYRKVHLAVHINSESMEGGMTPGKTTPVFKCDFGKLGIQICFDMAFDDGWEALRRQGADLVVWPTASPTTVKGRMRAYNNRYYIVSSTFRDQAAVFEPTGMLTARIARPKNILVQEIDLSYALLPWSPKLRDGKALKEKYGDKVGFRYYRPEDGGIFWSNDRNITIGEMVRSINVAEVGPERDRVLKLYKKKGIVK